MCAAQDALAAFDLRQTSFSPSRGSAVISFCCLAATFLLSRTHPPSPCPTKITTVVATSSNTTHHKVRSRSRALVTAAAVLTLVHEQDHLQGREATTLNNHHKRTVHLLRATASHTAANTKHSPHLKPSMCKCSCRSRRAEESAVLTRPPTFRRQQQPDKGNDMGCCACLAGACLCCCAEGT